MAVIREPQSVKIKKSETNSEISFTTQELIVTIDKNSGSINYSRPSGSLLIKEKSGTTLFQAKEDIGQPTYQVAQTFVLDADEDIYGLGQQQRGAWSQRGQEYYLFNNNMHICIPYIYSEKGYGLYWDNYSPTTFKDDNNGMLFDSEVGDCIDYYIFVGDNAEDVISDIRYLTGDAQLCPLWTLGFFQCRE